MYVSNVFGQESYADDKVQLTSDIKDLEDKQNDRFYTYYVFKIKNKTNETIKIDIDFIYSDGATTRNKSNGDNPLVFTLAPNETIEGDINDLKALTLFKKFNVGNSGKKASDVEYDLKEIKVKYL
jgi:hypothetical protein